MEESSSCPICLESLFDGDGGNAADTPATGATVPCGHLCHVKCWDEWMAASMTNHHRHQQSTKCPMCNSATTALVRLFLTVPTARNQRNDDDDDDSEESGMESDDDGNDDDNGELGETSPTIAATTTSRPNPRSVTTPTILDLLSDDDDNDGPVIVTIDDDPVVIDVTATERRRSPNVTLVSQQNTKKNAATHTNSSSKNNKMSLSLQKYRRKVRTLRQQKKTLQSQSHKNMEQYRKTLETLATTQQAYDDLTTQFAALEKTEHDTQLRYNQIMLQQVQMQRRTEAAQEQLQQQAALLQTKQAEMQRMEAQHAKQFKEYRNKNPQQLREVQSILQERPLLLEQVRTMQRQLDHHRKQQSQSSSSSSRSSDSVPTTTTHRQRQELLRTIRQGIDDSATVPPPLPSKKRRQVAVESMEQMSDVAPWDRTSHLAGPTLFRSAQSKTLTNVAPTKALISNNRNHQSLTNHCKESDNDDDGWLRDLQARNQRPLKRSSHHQEPRRVHSTKHNNEIDDDDENRVPQRRHSDHPPPSSSSSRPYDPSTKTIRGTNDPKRLNQMIMMHPPSFPSVATTTTQVPVVKKRQTTISFATKRA